MSRLRVDSMTVHGDHDLGLSFLPVYSAHSDTLATFTTLKRTPAQNNTSQHKYDNI